MQGQTRDILPVQLRTVCSSACSYDLFMAQSKDSKRNTKKDEQKPTGYKSGQGNMGAGRSGTENLGSEKPSIDENMGSQKAGRKAKNRRPSHLVT
jgi:hypothetical protein